MSPQPPLQQQQQQQRGAAGVRAWGRYWGGSLEARRIACRWDGGGWVRCPTTGSSPRPLRLPVCQSGSACAGVVILGFRGGSAPTRGTFEPRTSFSGDSHGAPSPGGEDATLLIAIGV